jgi:hypothetical protein
MQALFVVSGIVDRLALAQLVAAISGGESICGISFLSSCGGGSRADILGGDDKQVSVLAFLHPFPQPLFRLLVLIVVLGACRQPGSIEITPEGLVMWFLERQCGAELTAVSMKLPPAS